MKTRPNGHIWMVAEQFFNTAELVWKTSDGHITSNVYPLIVNYAFSCELALKASVGVVKVGQVTPDGLVPAAATKSAIRGHNLSDLFKNLPPPIQSSIAASFLSSEEEDIIPLLEMCSNYFEEARYPLEKIGGSYDLSGVRNLARGLLQAVRKLP